MPTPAPDLDHVNSHVLMIQLEQRLLEDEATVQDALELHSVPEVHGLALWLGELLHSACLLHRAAGQRVPHTALHLHPAADTTSVNKSWSTRSSTANGAATSPSQRTSGERWDDGTNLSALAGDVEGRRGGGVGAALSPLPLCVAPWSCAARSRQGHPLAPGSYINP